MEIAFDVALPHCGGPPRCRRCVTHHPWEKSVTERQQQPGLAEAIDDHLIKTVGVSPARAGPIDLMLATAQVAREQLSRRWVNTRARERDSRARRVYYLSMEFLMGRSLLNTLWNLGVKRQYQEALAELGYDLEVLADQVCWRVSPGFRHLGPGSAWAAGKACASAEHANAEHASCPVSGKIDAMRLLQQLDGPSWALLLLRNAILIPCWCCGPLYLL